RSVLLTNAVVRLEPLTSTTEPFAKFDPLTVSVKGPLPTTIVAGEMFMSDGVGLLIVKACDVLVPAPGVDTAIETNPAVDSALAGIVAVNWVLLTKAVLRLEPLSCITDALTKLTPVAVSVIGPLPARAEAGEMAVSPGSAGVLGVIVRLRTF